MSHRLPRTAVVFCLASLVCAHCSSSEPTSGGSSGASGADSGATSGGDSGTTGATSGGGSGTATGATGSTGSTGATGSTGSTGSTGATGGLSGSTGATDAAMDAPSDASLDGPSDAPPDATDAVGDVTGIATVRLAQPRQKVDGFGFSTAWGSVPDATLYDAFFSVTRGAGLSIVRNRIPFRERPGTLDDKFMGGGAYPSVTVGEGEDAYKKFTLNWGNWDLGATKRMIAAIKGNKDYELTSVFSTPWTPPNNGTSKWKAGVADYVNKPDVGGYLDPSHYADYADVLADYALGFEANMGAPLAALSLQNEPNYKVDYESADWSKEQIHEFLKVLKVEFTKKGVFTTLPQLTLMAPEYNNWKEDLILPSLADDTTASLLGIVAGHQYEFGWGGNPLDVNFSPMTTAIAADKRIWMTEWAVEKFGDGDDLAANLALAKLIHVDFTSQSLNAFVYWWTSALVKGGTPKKVLWTLAQWSRFIRPGWHRVDCDATPAQDVLVTSFVNAPESQAAIVVVNMGSSPQAIPLELDTKTFGPITPYRTSATENITALPSLPGGRAQTVMVPAKSITTFTAALE